MDHESTERASKKQNAPHNQTKNEVLRACRGRNPLFLKAFVAIAIQQAIAPQIDKVPQLVGLTGTATNKVASGRVARPTGGTRRGPCWRAAHADPAYPSRAGKGTRDASDGPAPPGRAYGPESPGPKQLG